MSDNKYRSRTSINDTAKQIFSRIDKIGEFKSIKTVYPNLDKAIKSASCCSLPASVMIYGGSSYGDSPYVSRKFSILFATTYLGNIETSLESLYKNTDLIINSLDNIIINDFLVKVKSDEPVNISDNVIGIMVNFEIEDN